MLVYGNIRLTIQTLGVIKVVHIGFVFFCCCWKLQGQYVEKFNTAERLGTALAKNVGRGVVALYGNPSMLHLPESSWQFLSASERRFTSDIIGSSLGIVKKINGNSSLGLLFGDYGIEGYNVTRFGMAYSMTLSDRLHIGSLLQMDQLKVQDYGTDGVIDAKLGLVYRKNKSTIGFTAENLLSSLSRDFNSPFIVSLGGLFEFVEKVESFWEVEMVSGIGPMVKIGLRYDVFDRTRFTLGFTNRNPVFSIGVQCHLPIGIKILIGSLVHQHLGQVSGLTIEKNIE